MAVDGEDSTLVSLVAFSDTAVQALLELRKGDQAAVAGSAKPTSWTGRDGKECHGLSIIVERVMSLYEVRQRPRGSRGRPGRGLEATAVEGNPHTAAAVPIDNMADEIPS